MNVEAQFTRIIEQSKDKEIIPFLRGCTPQERKSLIPLIKRLTKFYQEFTDNGFGSWRMRGNDKQREILQVVQFVCYTKKDFQGAGTLHSINREFYEKILPWYTPSWFGDFLNDRAKEGNGPNGLNYDLVIWLETNGYLQPCAEMYAQTLAPWIFEWQGNKHCSVPEKLTRYPDTLASHIWSLFQVQTSISYLDRNHYVGERVKVGPWMGALADCWKMGLVNRERLLKESLLASHKNFDKSLSSWFMDLFIYLEPDEEELLALREELINTFSSQHSKVVHEALKLYKSIVDTDGFPMHEFMDHAAVLLSSETKAVVAQCLQVLEKIIKKDKAVGPAAARLVTSVFIHKDEALQTRAAKIIDKWGDVNDISLREALMFGMGSMLSEPREMLARFLDNADTAQEEMLPVGQPLRLVDFPQITPIHDMDEWVFLCSQSFDNNQPWHIDQFLEAALRLNREIKVKDLEKFAPAIQRALKIHFGEMRSTQGMLDLMMAQFFLDMMLMVAERFPYQHKCITELYEEALRKSESSWKTWLAHRLKTRFLSAPDRHTSQIYKPWYTLIAAVLHAIETHQHKVLLSTPTHAPCWIDPTVLVNRFREVQQGKFFMDAVDLEIALCRCWLQDTSAAVALASQMLEGEYQRLMMFLLEKVRRPEGPFTADHMWMTASLVKDPQTVFPELEELSYSRYPRSMFTGQFAWKTVEEEFTYKTSDWSTGKYRQVDVKAMRKEIKVEITTKPIYVENVLSKLVSFFKITKEKHVTDSLIFEHMRIEHRYLSREDHDIQRIYGLMPSNPEPLMASILKKSLSQNLLAGEMEKRMVTSHLQTVHELQPNLGEMGHLYLSACLLCADKTVATYAAEIWLQRYASLDHQLLGRMLGTHQRIEFVPMKRLTDLMVAKMMGVSGSTDAALETLISAMFLAIQDAPVKGMKKLLEIQAELQKRLNRK